MDQYDNDLRSHFFKQIVNDIEHDYRITENEGKFGIEQDGAVIAEIGFYENWEQTAGAPLDNELFTIILEWIERNFE